MCQNAIVRHFCCQMSAACARYCAAKGEAKGRSPVALPFDTQYCVQDVRYAR